MGKPSWRKGIPLEERLQERLRALMREKGEKVVAALLEIGQISVVRAAAGLGLRSGTAFVIKTKLDAIAGDSCRAA